MRKVWVVFAIVLLTAGGALAQVHIHETTVIVLGQAKGVSSIWDDPQCPIYPEVGGTIRIWFVRTSSSYTAGYSELTWNGLNKNGSLVSSGVYFYRISTDNWSKVKKMLMIK